MEQRKRIYLCLAHMSESGEEQKYIKEAFDTNWVVPLGPNVNGFESDLERFMGEGKSVVALSAGTAAVHLALVACGVDILAVQGTGALRPDGSTSAQFIRAIKAKYPEQLVMADCDNLENAMLCAEAGADFVGTTMRGYTPETTGIDDIDFDFIRKLSAECPAKIIAEGHIHYPEQAVKALEAGAFALVVGGAITRPAEITARFTGAINAAKK